MNDRPVCDCGGRVGAEDGPPTERADAAREWAPAVWTAWRDQHHLVRSWAAEPLR